jgi:hypothetical protein
VTTRFDPQRIAELTDPTNYLGLSVQMVDRVVGDR